MTAPADLGLGGEGAASVNGLLQVDTAGTVLDADRRVVDDDVGVTTDIIKRVTREVTEGAVPLAVVGAPGVGVGRHDGLHAVTVVAVEGHGA